MKKRIIILIGFIFLLCGCDAEVNLTVTNSSVDEVISINAYPYGSVSKNDIPASFRDYIPVSFDTPIVDTEPDEPQKNIIYYNKTIKDINNGYNVTYSYKHSIKDYQNAKSFKNAFLSSNFYKNHNDKTILISTDKSGMNYFKNYPYLDKVVVNIDTKLKVKENNADSVVDNVYTWVFTKDNYQKNIYMLIDQFETNPEVGTGVIVNPEVKEPSEEKDDTEVVTEQVNDIFSKHPVLFVVGVIISFLLLIVILSKLSKSK